MRVVSGLIVGFYTLMFWALGALLIGFGFHWISYNDVVQLLSQLYTDRWFTLATAICGILMILISLWYIQLMVVKFQREKTIAFNTPDGQVTISLSAIEDFIRKMARQLAEVKEIKPDVIAGRKGVTATCRVTLWGDANIPEVAERLQGILRHRLQDMLGLADPIVVRVHVSKIASREGPAEKPKSGEPSFRGIEYR